MQIVLTKQIKCHSGLSTNNFRRPKQILSVKQPPNPPLFNGQHQGGENTNQNQMKKTPLVYIVFQVLKELLTKNC